MKNYTKELWLGEIPANGGWNWDIRGIPKDNHEDNIKACDEFIKELESIKEFYANLKEGK